MKRSRNVALVIVGAAALAGCEEQDPGGTVFQSLADCRQFYDEDICRSKATEAEKSHADTAPKYATREACEAAVGAEACVPTNEPPKDQAVPPAQQQQQAQSGGSWFMPAMMGFMLGRALSPPVPLYYGPPAATGAPQGAQERALYSGRSFHGTTTAATTRAFSASAPASASRVTTTPSSASRGGFGSTGRSYSGGSGS